MTSRSVLIDQTTNHRSAWYLVNLSSTIGPLLPTLFDVCGDLTRARFRDHLGTIEPNVAIIRNSQRRHRTIWIEAIAYCAGLQLSLARIAIGPL
jgi:hypothetical protein